MQPPKLQQQQINNYGYAQANLLVNPGFEIWQRGAGPFVHTTTSQDVFTADEWAILTTGGTVSASRNTSPAHGEYALALSNTTNNLHAIAQGIENYKSLEGLWLTFSVDVKSTVASDTRLIIGDHDGTQEIAYSDYHTGGGGWERLTVTKLIRTGLTTETWAHGFGLVVEVQSSNTSVVYIDGASLVIGNFPQGVPFIPLNPADDQQRCERFYQTSTGSGNGDAIWWSGYAGSSGKIYFGTYQFATRFQAIPTMTLTNHQAVAFPATSGTAYASIRGFMESRYANATNQDGNFASHWTAEVT